MSDWELTINKAENGYVVTHESEISGDIIQTVFEEKEEDDVEAMRDLLNFISTYFGIYYSKHKKKNLVVEVKE